MLVNMLQKFYPQSNFKSIVNRHRSASALFQSARACLMVGRRFRFMATLSPTEHGDDHSGILSTQGRCTMHMFAVNVGEHIRRLNCITPVFCGSCLLSRGSVRKQVRQYAHNNVWRNMEFDTSPVEPADHALKANFIEAV